MHAAFVRFVQSTKNQHNKEKPMYLRKLQHEECLVAANHSEDEGRKKLLSMLLFALIVIFSILLSSLSELEIKFF